MSLHERLTFSLRTSLYARSFAFVFILVCTGGVILSLIAARYAHIAADAAYDRLLIGGVIQVAENLYLQGEVVTLDPPVAAFSSLSDYDQIFYKVVDERGVVVAGNADLGPTVMPLEARIDAVLGDGSYLEHDVRLAIIAKNMGDSVTPSWATVVLAQTRNARGELASGLTRTASLIILAMSLLTLAMSTLAIRLAFAPLARIENAMRGRDPNDLLPLNVETPSEIYALVGSINFFLDQLAKRVTMMQRFIADAAHQIRTPLAALDSQLELLANESVAQRRVEQIGRVRERSKELARLTGQLLNHAMVIHRAEAVAFEPVDLVTLSREVLARAIPLSLDREISTSFDCDAESIIVNGDVVSLGEALSNVIHNAITHGAATTVAIQVNVNASGARIEVSDDGCGIPVALWERVREPFYSEDTLCRGSGLGLAIVEDVMQAHRGELQFREKSTHGFAVILFFRASPPATYHPA